MFETSTALSPLLDRLLLRVNLSQADKDAVSALPQSVRFLKATDYFIREGDVPTHCCILVAGFIVRSKVVAGSSRQIVALHMRGDMVGLQNVLLERSDHDVQALTDAELLIIPRTSLEELAFAHPSVGKALWRETLVDASVFQEWIANIGRRDARTRVAHLLCEFAIRLEAAGLAKAGSFELPMTQEQLADTLSLTSVHINRTLMVLANEGLIEREQRSILVRDWEKLTRAADFNPAYLHLPNGRFGL